MTVYKVPVTVKKIKTFLKNALVFDMEFYFGHIIIHTYVRTSLYVCITIWEYTCTNMFSDAGKTYFGIPYIFASNLTLVFGLSGNFWLVSFKISYLCLPLFYEPRTTPSCHPSGCAYRQL